MDRPKHLTASLTILIILSLILPNITIGFAEALFTEQASSQVIAINNSVSPQLFNEKTPTAPIQFIEFPSDVLPLEQYDIVMHDLYGSNARAYDVNGNTILDSGDYLGYDENGVITGRPLTDTEIYDVLYRSAAVYACYAMDAKAQAGKIMFTGSTTATVTDQFWAVGGNVKPSDAINDVFNLRGGTYTLDSDTAANLILYKARLDAIGAEDFDNEYKKFAINGWQTTYQSQGKTLDTNGALDYITGDSTTPGDGTSLNTGDWTYFTGTPGISSQGQNAITLGRDSNGALITYAFSDGFRTGTQYNNLYLSSVKGWINPDALKTQDKKTKPNKPTITPTPSPSPLPIYSPILEYYYGPGAQVVDANLYPNSTAGALDRGDTIQYYQDGVITIKPMGPNETYNLAYRARMIENSKLLEAKTLAGKIGFAENNASTQFNPEYWTNIGGPDPLWQVKQGVKPSDAINDIFDINGGSYSMDCNEAMQLISLKSRLDVIGPEDFDRKYAGLAMTTTGVYANTGDGLTQLPTGAFDSATGDFTSPGTMEGRIPGDATYFYNPYGEGATQGENAVFLGKDEYGEPQFYGHPYGTFTGTEQEFGYLSQFRATSDQNNISALDENPQQCW